MVARASQLHERDLEPYEFHGRSSSPCFSQFLVEPERFTDAATTGVIVQYDEHESDPAVPRRDRKPMWTRSPYFMGSCLLSAPLIRQFAVALDDPAELTAITTMACLDGPVNAEVNNDALDGLVALQLPKKTLFQKTIEVRIEDLPRWTPKILFDECQSESDE